LEPVPQNKVKLLSGKIAELYSRYVPKTLDRDLSILRTAGLIEQKDDKIRTRTEIVLQFLPSRLIDEDEEFEVMIPAKEIQEVLDDSA